MSVHIEELKSQQISSFAYYKVILAAAPAKAVVPLELLTATAVCATLEVLVTTGNAPRDWGWQRQATERALLRSNFTSSWDSCNIPRHSAFRSCNSWSWKRREEKLSCDVFSEKIE